MGDHPTRARRQTHWLPTQSKAIDQTLCRNVPSGQGRTAQDSQDSKRAPADALPADALRADALRAPDDALRADALRAVGSAAAALAAAAK